MTLAVGNYTYQEGRISYELASGGNGVISTDEVDWNATTRVNSQRGIRVTLRGGHPTTRQAGSNHSPTSQKPPAETGGFLFRVGTGISRLGHLPGLSNFPASRAREETSIKNIFRPELRGFHVESQHRRKVFEDH